MTVRISPDYAKRVFDELPGRTRSEKAEALSVLFRLLRDERDSLDTKARRPRTMQELLPTITGASLKDLANLNAAIDGLSIPVTTLMHAFLRPESSMHDLARSVFGDVGLTVVVDPVNGKGRPVTRLVTKAQAALNRVVASRETLETMLADRSPSPWIVTKVELGKLLGRKGGDA